MDGGLSWAGLNQGLPALPVRAFLATPNGAAGARIEVEGFGALEWQPGNPAGWMPLDPATLEADMRRARLLRGTGAAEVDFLGARRAIRYTPEQLTAGFLSRSIAGAVSAHESAGGVQRAGGSGFRG